MYEANSSLFNLDGPYLGVDEVAFSVRYVQVGFRGKGNLTRVEEAIDQRAIEVAARLKTSEEFQQNRVRERSQSVTPIPSF